MKRVVSLLVLLILVTGASWADQNRAEVLERLDRAGTVLNEIMAAPDKGIPEEVLSAAECVAIVPSMVKGGFVVGARYGRGMATCRQQGRWSAPAPIFIGGGSYGLQIGGEAVDLVMLVMNEGGMKQLLNSKFEIGADVSAAAGPIGRHAQAKTDWKLQSQVLTYSRARGAFAGATLNGAAIKQDEDSTRALYGKAIPFQQLLSGKVPPPEGAQEFLASVRKNFREARGQEVREARREQQRDATTGGTTGAATTPPQGQAGDTAGTGAVAGRADTTSGAAGGTTTAAMSNDEVRGVLEKAMRNEPGLSTGNVNVSVTDDAVQLSGTVASNEEKDRLRRIAEAHAGNRKVVADNLTVK